MIFETVCLCLFCAGAIGGATLLSQRSEIFVGLVKHTLGLPIAIDEIHVDFLKRKVLITHLQLLDLFEEDPDRQSTAPALCVSKIELQAAKNSFWFPIDVEIRMDTPVAFLRFLATDESPLSREDSTARNRCNMRSNWSVLAARAASRLPAPQSEREPLLRPKSLTIANREGGRVVSWVKLDKDDPAETEVFASLDHGSLPIASVESPEHTVQFLTDLIQTEVDRHMLAIRTSETTVSTASRATQWSFFGIQKAETPPVSGRTSLPVTDCKESVPTTSLDAQTEKKANSTVASLIAAFEDLSTGHLRSKVPGVSNRLVQPMESLLSWLH